jgi:hypothetical protein
MNLEGLLSKSTADWVDVALILPDHDRMFFWQLIGAICVRSANWPHVHKMWSTGLIEGPTGYDSARQLLHQWKADHPSKERLDIGA